MLWEGFIHFHQTNDMSETMQILKCYVINPKHMPINVLPEEEGQIFPYEKHRTLNGTVTTTL